MMAIDHGSYIPVYIHRRLLKDQVCEATNKGHNFKIMPLLPILLKP